MKKYTLEDVKKALRPRDAWWPVLVIDPIVIRLILPIANYTNITPNEISIAKFLIKLVSAYFFYKGDKFSLIIGAILFEIGFMCDCMDGILARLKNMITKFGIIFDKFEDHFSYVVLAFTLGWGQYRYTHDKIFIINSIICIVLVLLNDYFDIFKPQAMDAIDSLRERLGKLENWLAKRRLIPIPSTIEWTQVLFVFAPIFGFIPIGYKIFIVAYIVMVVSKLITLLKLKIAKNLEK